MQLLDIGPRGFLQGNAVATLSFTPNVDRAAVLVDVSITAPSANDIWDLFVNGFPVMSFNILTVGNQQLLRVTNPGAAGAHSLFTLYYKEYGNLLTVPIPQAATLQLKSRGGATAYILLEYYECSPGDITPAMPNHYQGNHFICPIYGLVSAAVVAAGDALIDTQVGPAWAPLVLTMPAASGTVQVGYVIKPLLLFLEAGGVNTFSGAANHQSVTDHLVVKKGGLPLLTRTLAASAGIPMVGVASAAASANTVYGTLLGNYYPFQQERFSDLEPVDNWPPIVAGDRYQFYLNITGDVTGGASYANHLVCLIADFVRVGGSVAGA